MLSDIWHLGKVLGRSVQRAVREGDPFIRALREEAGYRIGKYEDDIAREILRNRVGNARVIPIDVIRDAHKQARKEMEQRFADTYRRRLRTARGFEALGYGAAGAALANELNNYLNYKYPDKE